MEAQVASAVSKRVAVVVVAFCALFPLMKCFISGLLPYLRSFYERDDSLSASRDRDNARRVPPAKSPMVSEKPALEAGLEGQDSMKRAPRQRLEAPNFVR